MVQVLDLPGVHIVDASVPLWTVGILGDRCARDVPRILQSVQMRAGVVLVDGNEIDEQDFNALVAQGQGVRFVKPLVYDEDRVFYLAALSEMIDPIPSAEADARLTEFVSAMRERGRQSWDRGLRRSALNYFDRARRVSNDPDDYVRVFALEHDRCMKALWMGWLEQHAPDVDILSRMLQLGFGPYLYD